MHYTKNSKVSAMLYKEHPLRESPKRHYADEQRQVGSFFTNIDRLIALHQHELTKLQNIKKALLEKMFV